MGVVGLAATLYLEEGGGSDHGGVVGRELRWWNKKVDICVAASFEPVVTGLTRLRARRPQVPQSIDLFCYYHLSCPLTEKGVGGDAAGEEDGAWLVLVDRLRKFVYQIVDSRVLEAGGEAVAVVFCKEGSKVGAGSGDRNV